MPIRKRLPVKSWLIEISFIRRRAVLGAVPDSTYDNAFTELSSLSESFEDTTRAGLVAAFSQ